MGIQWDVMEDIANYLYIYDIWVCLQMWDLTYKMSISRRKLMVNDHFFLGTVFSDSPK